MLPQLRTAFVSASSLAVPNAFVASCNLSHCQKKLAVEFNDNSKFLFSGLWLRDACRDAQVISHAAGERILTKIPMATKSCGVIHSAEVNNDIVKIQWADDKDVSESYFEAGFLRQYASAAAKMVNSSESSLHPVQEHYRWLEPYTGFPHARAPTKDMVKLWKNDGAGFQHCDYNTLFSSDSANLEFLQTLMRNGIAIVDNVPPSAANEPINTTILNFTDKILGGMQKDPARTDPNWVIQKKENAQSISYAQQTRLNNHTDQSVPAHGIPALLLVVHYVKGMGKNTLVDSYAVSERLRQIDPSAFDLLSRYGNDQERDFVASRVDSVQEGTQGMLISTKQPIIQLDHLGNHVRTQYNEVFRTPSTIPFDVFEDWYRAYLLFNEMLHGEEFEVTYPLQEGQILVLNNWRVLHGRAGRVSSADRCIMGGTVVREAFCSRATTLMGASFPRSQQFE